MAIYPITQHRIDFHTAWKYWAEKTERQIMRQQLLGMVLKMPKAAQRSSKSKQAIAATGN
jgi:hypothetical protein